jgi:hypothetical protein
MLPRHLELKVFSYVMEVHRLLLVGNSRTGKSTLVRRCYRDVDPKLVRTSKNRYHSTLVTLPLFLTCNVVLFKELGGYGKYRPHSSTDLASATRVLIVVKNGVYLVSLFEDVLWFMKRYKSLQKPFTIVINMRTLDDSITDTDNATLSILETLGVRHIRIPSLEEDAAPADIRRLLHLST